MSFLHLVFCSLTVYSVSDGRIVLGIIGQDVSLSWKFSIIKSDVFYILHNGSPIHQFVPNRNSSIPLQPPQRGFSTVYYTMPENVTVTIHILDLTENDAGTYRVVRQWNLEDVDKRVDLQIIGITYYTPVAIIKMETTEGITYYTPVAKTKMETTEGITYYTPVAKTKMDTTEGKGEVLILFDFSVHTLFTFSVIGSFTPMATTQKESTEGIYDYTTTALKQKVITEGINHDKTTAMTSEVDAEAFPSKSHLLYIVLGMGGILAFAFIACLQHKVRICLRTDRASNANRVTNSIKDDGAENIQDDNLSGNYWTIVSNPSGELRTAIEMNLERHSEPQLIAQTMVHIDIESEEIFRTSNITRKEELDGYLNPVHSIPTELSDYIHPVHSDPVNATSACIQYIEIL